MNRTEMRSFDKISITAKFVAYWRQYTDIPFAKDVAEYIGANETIETFFKDNNVAPIDVSWYAPLFEVRYKSILSAVRRYKIKQTVELASGLSLRGLSITRDPKITYIETDLEGLTKDKTVLIASLMEKYALTDYGNFHLCAANALNLKHILSAVKYLRSGEPIAIISEGLFPYLTLQEMTTVITNINKVLTLCGGVWITPDFLLKSDSTRTFNQRRIVGKAIAKLTGRQLHSNMFDSKQQISAFCENLGFRVEVLNQVDLAPDITSLEVLKLPGSIIEKARPKLNLWVLTPFP